MQRGKKRVLKVGQKIHSFTVLRNLPGSKKESPIKRRKVRAVCVCGKELVIPIWYLFRPKPKMHCGCLNRIGLRYDYPREFHIWTMMNYRCQSEKHEAYPHYGGRGIYVCKEWHKDRGVKGFESWFEYIGPAPSKKHSIDRIDNDGSYTPGNVRWATAKQQNNNQRRNR